jgi:hypothetical protein
MTAGYEKVTCTNVEYLAHLLVLGAYRPFRREVPRSFIPIKGNDASALVIEPCFCESKVWITSVNGSVPAFRRAEKEAVFH